MSFNLTFESYLYSWSFDVSVIPLRTYFLETSVWKPNFTSCCFFPNFEGITSFIAVRKTFLLTLNQNEISRLKYRSVISSISGKYDSFLSRFLLVASQQIIEQKINYSVAQNKGTERCVLSTGDVINFVLLKSACQRWLPSELQVFTHITSTRWIINYAFTN
jgi:hypothetical protein